VAINKITIKGIWQILKKCFSNFSDDRVMKLSASLAYYTVFSLGPLLIVIVFFSSIFFGKEAVEGSVYGQMASFVGSNAALQLQDIIKNAAISGKSYTAIVIGISTLLVGATTVFAEIQDSINMIWGLKAKPKKGWLKFLRNRLLSFGVLGSLGFLLLVSLAISAIIEGISNRLKIHFPAITVIVFYILNLVITFGVVATLFSVIFKVLPDAKIKWKDVMAGAITTATLFMMGKFAISFYIAKSSIGSTYGTAGSLVVLLVWIYYSAVILYFGAEFTKAWAIEYGNAIRPNDYAVAIETIEKEKGHKTIQQIENEKKQPKN
jgi:membrane protein